MILFQSDVASFNLKIFSVIYGNGNWIENLIFVVQIVDFCNLVGSLILLFLFESNFINIKDFPENFNCIKNTANDLF